jgi:diguanylate cyclase (GGDEF)-like protein
MALDVILDATRAMLRLSSPADARGIAVRTVELLGGVVVAASDAGPEALPVDLSFGDGQPLLPSAPSSSVARLLMERHLPALVEDLRRAVELSSRTSRLAEDALTDPLTGLPNRRMLGRVLGRTEAGQTVIIIDLDEFKRLNDEHGHAVGDAVLRSFAMTLRATARGIDVVGRFGGEEFAVVLRAEADADGFLDRLRREWERRRTHPITFSAGIARVVDGAGAALEAADQAMYDAKSEGRNRWCWARADRPHGASSPREPTEEPPGFVAFSELQVPDGGRDALEQAFRDRLGAVDGVDGFRRLEVWADLAEAASYVMVSWWSSREDFLTYMRSPEHQRSHDRIPTGPARPRPRRFRRFRQIET